MGVVFARFAEDDKIIAIAKNSERNIETADAEAEAVESTESPESPADGESESQ